jgi:uncharacterized protein YqfB (UPF0267 family)
MLVAPKITNQLYISSQKYDIQVVNIEVKQLHSITKMTNTLLHAKQSNLHDKKVDKMIRSNGANIILTILIVYVLTSFFSTGN